MSLILVSAILTCVVGYLYYKLTQSKKIWEIKGVPHEKPSLFVGNSKDIMAKTLSLPDFIQKYYNMFPDARYSGLFFFNDPTLMIHDPALIKRITIKDFEHFLDHKQFIPKNIDPLWTRNLFSLEGQEWRDMRVLLTPCFTTSKMKQLHDLIHEMAKIFTLHFEKHNQDFLEVELKDIFARFTNDVIALCAWGVKIDSIADKDNFFYKMARKSVDFGGLVVLLKTFIYTCAPSIGSMLNLTLFPKNMTNYFFSLIKDTINAREDKGIVRQDMLHMLLEARKTAKKSDVTDNGFSTIEESHLKTLKSNLTDMDIAAQAFVFFVGGFETVSSLMCFMGHELAVHQDIQEKLREEIQTTLKETNGKVTYEAIQKMKYLDMVVMETLRKWPSQSMITRTCTKPYTIEPERPGEKPLTIEKDTSVWIPVYALHRDPLYFPDPDKFDPERFRDENKENKEQLQYVYIPFGVGPRNCVGNRFAVLETKLMFFELLSKFKLVTTEKTGLPLKISRNGFSMTAEGGFNYALKKQQ